MQSNKRKKILSIMALVVSATPLILFILFVLLIDLSGTHSWISLLERKVTIMDRISLYLWQRWELLKDLFPYIIIPLIVDIIFIALSIRSIRNLQAKDTKPKI